jgi:predicted RNA-binding protein YlxR (DUF448 family)
VGGSAKRLSVPRVRKCAACGTERPRTELIRVVRLPGGGIEINTSGPMPGRGAYLCARAECIRLAAKKNSLSRVLKRPVPQEIYAMIGKMCDRGENDQHG